MSFNLWERLKWFHLFIYLISWHSNLTFSFRGALYKDNRGPTPAKTALELAEIRSLYTEEQHGISLGHSAASPRNQDSLECLQGRGSPLTTPGLFSKIRHCWPALSNSENLAIICQTKEHRARAREGILLLFSCDVNWFAIMWLWPEVRAGAVR